VFSVEPRSLGRGIDCPRCGRNFTARPLELWKKLEARQAKIERGDLRGGAPDKEAHPRAQRRYLYHPAPEGAAGPELASDPMYEASLDRAAPLLPTADVVAVLDDIRSQWNVGAIFRTADAAGLAGLVLTGITATPPARIVAKTALGAEEMVPWRYRASVVEALRAAEAEGREVWALELGEGAETVFDVRPPRRMTLLLGNEVVGVSSEALAIAKKRVAIPMAGRKGSLNVAVAFGIAAFAIARAWRTAHGNDAARMGSR
jgi:tRNA(Leu) C34 or U34 (ribose-2'-O)-methylase TrmL